MSDTSMVMADKIAQEADHLARRAEMAETKRDRAAAAGAALAAEVYRYVESPQEVGRSALREAYSTFMAQHAGNFSS